jgi:hypothetical protein
VARSARGSGRPLEAAGNGGPRWMTTARVKPGTGSGLQAGSLLSISPVIDGRRPPFRSGPAGKRLSAMRRPVVECGMDRLWRSREERGENGRERYGEVHAVRRENPQ